MAENVYIQPFTTVGHDIVVNSSCVISPYCELGGCDIIGQETYIGVHASLKELAEPAAYFFVKSSNEYLFAPFISSD